VLLQASGLLETLVMQISDGASNQFFLVVSLASLDVIMILSVQSVPVNDLDCIGVFSLVQSVLSLDFDFVDQSFVFGDCSLFKR
jgi:hypothetical protein